MDLFCLRHQKKALWCRKQVVVVVVVVCLFVCLFVLRFGRTTTTTRRRARKKSGEIETGKRRGRGSGEERVGRVVAWAAFFRERKGKDFALDFYFFVPEFSLSSTQRALCVVARDHCTHFASLGRASSSSVGPGGGGDVKRGGRTR